MSNLTTLTYSSLACFRDCRKRYNWRFVEELVPVEPDPHLVFGAVIHRALALWHRSQDLALVMNHLDQMFANRSSDPEQKANWQLARAMMSGYAARYPQEDFRVQTLEQPFACEIRNPATTGKSRTFLLRGKVDGLVERDGRLLLLKHKTASNLDGGYLERLWSDFQVSLYSLAIERCLGVRFDAVLYNILTKSRLQQCAGETEAEFEARRAELTAKNKTGTTSAKRRLPETDEEFQIRLAEWYSRPEVLCRQELLCSRAQVEAVEREIWEVCLQLLDARRRHVWSCNTSQCFPLGRPCPYVAACRSGGAPNVLENFFRREPPHGELKQLTEHAPVVPHDSGPSWVANPSTVDSFPSHHFAGVAGAREKQP